MKTGFEFVLDKAPWFVRWVFYLFWIVVASTIFLVVKGWQANEISRRYVTAIAEDVFEEKIAPINSERNTRYFGIVNTLEKIQDEQKSQGKVIYQLDGKLDAVLSTR